MRKIKSSILSLLLFLFVLSGCSNSSSNTENLPDNEIESSQAQNQKNPQAPAVSNNQPLADGNVNLYFIDVGQADACLIEYNGHFMLIDAGDNDDEQRMVNFLNEKGVSKLDYVFGTHPHADHIGGLDAVIDAFPIDEIYMPKVMASTQTFEDVLNALENKGLQVNTPVPGNTLQFQDLAIEVFGPMENYEDTNDNSIVLKLTYRDNSFLFTGDMEKQPEADILQAGYPVAADLIKIGHHGSDTSTSQGFIDAVNPSYAVISVGAGNSYGHPDESVISRLKNKNIAIYRTDLNGTIQAISNGSQISLQNEKNSSDILNTAPDTPTQSTETAFIGNKNSLKFHLPHCRSLPAENNQVLFQSREEAEAKGYLPCKICIGG